MLLGQPLDYEKALLSACQGGKLFKYAQVVEFAVVDGDIAPDSVPTDQRSVRVDPDYGSDVARSEPELAQVLALIAGRIFDAISDLAIVVLNRLQTCALEGVDVSEEAVGVEAVIEEFVEPISRRSSSRSARSGCSGVDSRSLPPP